MQFWMFLFLVVFFGVGLFLIYRKQVEQSNRFSDDPKPLWRHALAELGANLKHPHPFAKEMDELLAESDLEPEVPMQPTRYDRLLELLVERSTATNPELREGENDAALAYILLLRLARREANSPIVLSGIRLVGSQAPTAQTPADAAARESATNN